MTESQFHLYLIEVLSGLSVAGVIAAITGIMRNNSHLRRINGSLGKIAVWQEQHEKQDDDRHSIVLKLMDSVMKKSKEGGR